jgi:hypothetical protein
MVKNQETAMNEQLLYRQGDILIMAVDSIPDHLPLIKKPVLASGDSTGHSHQIRDTKSVKLYRNTVSREDRFEVPPEHYLEVLADETDVVHPEHAKITLPRGCYRVWRQREFGTIVNRPVVD